MPHHFIAKTSDFQKLLRRLEDAPVIGYDTEFISEGRYVPQLCLVQIAAGDQLYLVDPLAVDNLVPLWELFCDERREVIVHACRSEMEFCHRAVGRLPQRLFDVQVAAGFLGVDFPAGFRLLLEHFLKIDLPKAESRTVWNKRPLAPRQIEYALDDVRYLDRLAAILKAQLEETGRLAWYEAEIARIKEHLQHDFDAPRWRNLPKISRMKPRELAIVREVWFWRDRIAKKWNTPPGRVLRDDLLVELARRGTADPQRIASVRGFQRKEMARILPDLAETIDRALALTKDEWPSVSNRLAYPQYTVMTQFLYAALCSICKRENVAQQLVGGPGDVRDLIAAELGTLPKDVTPRLSRGWRSEMVGTVLHDLLRGRTVMRLNPATPEEPLVFTRYEPE